jgi:hypothetical protein
MPLTAQSRQCRLCRRLLPEPPAVPACEHCGAVHLPHHTGWPPLLKWYLLRELALTRFHSWSTEQEVWEDLLRDTRNGIRVGITQPNPHRHSIHAPAIELYAEVMKAAEGWRAAGSPIPSTTTTDVPPNVQRTV